MTSTRSSAAHTRGEGTVDGTSLLAQVSVRPAHSFVDAGAVRRKAMLPAEFFASTLTDVGAQ